MKDLEAKLSLESADELFDALEHLSDEDGEATVGLLTDIRALLVELVNEVRTIRAHHCSLPWPEHAAKSGGKGG